MALAPLNTMTPDELKEYVEALEGENQELRAKTDNRRKLSPQEVRLIRRLAEEDKSNTEIAEIFDVNPETVRRTVLRAYHKDVA